MFDLTHHMTRSKLHEARSMRAGIIKGLRSERPEDLAKLANDVMPLKRKVDARIKTLEIDLLIASLNG